jgi:hypothetical protein
MEQQHTPGLFLFADGKTWDHSQFLTVYKKQ